MSARPSQAGPGEEPVLIAVVCLGGTVDNLFELLEAADGWCRLLVVNGGEQPWTELERQALDGVVDHFDAAGLGPGAVAAALADRGVAGILTFRDELLRWTSRLARRLALPFHDEATALALTDKSRQRRLMAEAGLPQPRFARLDGERSLPEAVARVGFPAVLKPVAGSGSRDVVVLSDEAALVAHLRGTAAWPHDSWVLEQRMEGRPHPGGAWLADYVSVETLCLGPRRYRHLGVTDRLPMYPPLLEGGASLPSLLPEPERAEVCALAERALGALGVRSGISHTEIKLTPEGPRVIEVNGRVGGLVPQLSAAAGGPDVLRLALLSAAGRADEGREQPDRFAQHSIVLFVQPPVGARTVRRLVDVATLRAVPGVWRVDVHRAPGAGIDARTGLLGRVQTVFATAADPSGVEERWRILRRMTDRGTVFDTDTDTDSGTDSGTGTGTGTAFATALATDPRGSDPARVRGGDPR